MREILMFTAFAIVLIVWCFWEAKPYAGKGPYPEKTMMVTPRQAIRP